MTVQVMTRQRQLVKPEGGRLPPAATRISTVIYLMCNACSALVYAQFSSGGSPPRSSRIVGVGGTTQAVIGWRTPYIGEVYCKVAVDSDVAKANHTFPRYFRKAVSQFVGNLTGSFTDDFMIADHCVLVEFRIEKYAPRPYLGCSEPLSHMRGSSQRDRGEHPVQTRIRSFSIKWRSRGFLSTAPRVSSSTLVSSSSVR